MHCLDSGNEIHKAGHAVGGPADSPRLLKSPEAARYLAVSERTLWSLRDRGEIRCVQIGRSVRYDLEDLDSLIERRKCFPQKPILD